jgi:endonuclease/exonuclease/phosphatase family metal-dependent hydrolase
VKWNVRAVDWVAGAAMVGVLAAGGGLALGAFGTESPEIAPAVESDYEAGTITADDFEGEADEAAPDKKKKKKERKDRAEKDREPPKGTKQVGQLPGGSPIVFPGDPVPPEPVAQPVEFVVSSFNILGSTHTTNSPRFAPGPVRARSVVQLLLNHDVEIVGFQEMQNNQRDVIQNMAGDRYAMFPGASMSERESVNSIAWDVTRWEAVDSRVVDIPYFQGRIRKMPVVKLQNRSNDAQIWVGNFHNPANAGWGDNERWRERATQIEIQLANDLLEADGIPVIFTGDFNEREDVFCPMVALTPLVAANGGSNDGVCRPPVPTRIDWIFGTGITWLSYLADESALVRRTSDHPMIVAHAVLSPPDGGAAQEAEEALGRTEDAQDQ